MSVIADALKKAQRERMKRSSASATAHATPFVVQLRTVHGPTFSWPRALGMGVGAAFLIALVVFVVQLRGSSGRVPLPAVPPPPVNERIVEATPAAARQPSVAAPTHRDSTAGAPASISAAARAEAPSHAPAVVAQRPQTRTPDTASGARPGGGTGLRIAIDQQRGAEYARVFEQAVDAQRSGDTATARALYERLSSAAPRDADLLNNFGVLLTSTNERDRAAELLQRAVAIAPNNAGAWANLGFVLREQGKTTESIAAFQRALLLEPSRAAVSVSLAQQYLAAGSFTEARALLDRVLAENPLLTEAYYTRGQLSEMQGDPAAAIRDYTEFVRLAPARLAAYVARVRGHLDTLGAAARSR